MISLTSSWNWISKLKSPLFSSSLILRASYSSLSSSFIYLNAFLIYLLPFYKSSHSFLSCSSPNYPLNYSKSVSGSSDLLIFLINCILSLFWGMYFWLVVLDSWWSMTLTRELYKCFLTPGLATYLIKGSCLRMLSTWILRNLD